MKKTITLLTILLLVVFMVGCENSVNPINSDNPTTSVSQTDNTGISLAKNDKNQENNRERNNVKVEICHLTGNDEWITIEIDENAVQAHLDHGDMYLDGWVVDGGEWQFDFFLSGEHFIHTYDFETGDGYVGDITSIITQIACPLDWMGFHFNFDDSDEYMVATAYIESDGSVTGNGVLWFENETINTYIGGTWTTDMVLKKGCVPCQ